MSIAFQCIIVFEGFSLMGSCEQNGTEGWPAG